MNNIKNVIQKEEYISLAVNKYILQTGSIPKTSDGSLDWDKLVVADYLGINFNKTNPITSKDMVVTFDSSNNAYIKGIIETINNYSVDYNYLYNFYINKIYRVNTIPPTNITKEKLVSGSQILYGNIQKDIVSVVNGTIPSEQEVKSTVQTRPLEVKLANQVCISGKYFYELRDGKITLKYCKSDNSTVQIYQDAPIYLENWDDLQYIKANIGDKAYVKKNNFWYEYYYQGDVDSQKWIPSGTGDSLTNTDDQLSIADRILSYIPDSKDLVIRKDGGCMLANGDIFCWGDNQYKRAGIENYGQLDTTLTPNYINTPVMLKVQIEDIQSQDLISKKWYNNPYRVKFEKMAMNDKYVCGISPIFDYYESGVEKKYGGDLYCNGYVHSDYFYLDSGTTGQTTTSILRKNKMVATGKETGVYNSNIIYLKDIAMVNATWAVLSDAGKIYTVGSNEKGALGLGNTDYTVYTTTPQIINTNGQVFKKVYALRDSKTFGALDEQNYFWIWGERPDGTIINRPTILSNSKQFNSDGVFINSKEFVLKGIDNQFYRTYSNLSYKALSTVPSSALSVSVYDYKNSEYVVYVDENMKLQGDSLFLTCKKGDMTSCTTTDSAVFDLGFNELNKYSSTVNNKDYASFANVSIFEGKINQTIVNYGTDYTENFENGLTTGWNIGYIFDGGIIASKFLGLYGKNRINTSTVGGAQTLYKTFDLGTSNANKNVKISFDMYEIDSWDANKYWEDYLNGETESFFVYLNDLKVSRDVYAVDSTYPGIDSKDGVNLGNIPNTDGWDDEKHTYSFVTTLDANGKVKLGFGAILGEDYLNESFGIDNIKISKQIDNVTFTSNVYLEDFENGLAPDWIVPQGPVPYTTSTSEFYKYPIYTDSGIATKFLGRFNKKDGGSGVIYHGNSNSTEEVYKIFSFGAANANKEVQIEYDFYRIDNWRNNLFYTTDKFYTFINKIQYLTYSTGDIVSYTNLNEIDNTDWLYADYKSHFTRKEYLDEFGNIRLGFGAYIKDNYINQTSWGIDNVKFTLTGNINSVSSGGSSTQEVTVPYICTMTGLSTASQMYCWGNVGRSMPILSTSLYDVSKISTINKLFITQTNDKTKQMAFDEYNNNGNLFLKYPSYIGGFDYPFYFK